MIEGSDTGYIPRGDQLYLAITRGPSVARAESDGSDEGNEGQDV